MNTHIRNSPFSPGRGQVEAAEDALSAALPALAGGAADDAARSGDTPRLVTRGESPPDFVNPHAALVDWLNFTFPFKLYVDSFIELDTQFRQAFGFAMGKPRKTGFLNYEKSWELGENLSSLFAAGGESVGGTCMVSLSASGCMSVKDWAGVYDLVTRLRGRITRIDLAYDDFAGVMNIQTALGFRDSGGYTTNGRPPRFRYVDDFDAGTGKTLYVGSRKNGKLLRVYEKGKEQGLPRHPWIRWELELHNKDRVIDLETIIHPGIYLAGSYPCMSWVSETQDRVKTTHTIARTNFEHLLECCKQSYGKLIWLMHEGLGYSPQAIVETLSVKGIPSRLNIPVPGGDISS